MARCARCATRRGSRGASSDLPAHATPWRATRATHHDDALKRLWLHDVIHKALQVREAVARKPQHVRDDRVRMLQQQ
jgi:hypothetical protein